MLHKRLIESNNSSERQFTDGEVTCSRLQREWLSEGTEFWNHDTHLLPAATLPLWNKTMESENRDGERVLFKCQSIQIRSQRKGFGWGEELKRREDTSEGNQNKVITYILIITPKTYRD